MTATGPREATHGVRAIFFDAVGTLLFPDPPAAVVYSAIGREFGLDASPVEISHRFRAAFRAEEAADRVTGWSTGEAREEERWRRIVAACLPGVSDQEAAFRRLYVHFAQPTAWQIHPEAGAVLTALQDRGLVLGIASNFDTRLRQVLRGHPELVPVRERVVISSEVGARKPAAGFFAAVIAAAGCPAEHILFVGDDIENDHDGAAAARLVPLLIDVDQRHSSARRIRTLANLLD